MSSPAFNFLDLDLFAKDIPHAALAALRQTTPVFWHAMPSPQAPDDGFWLVTRYDDIVKIEKNTTVFSSHLGLTLAEAPPPGWGPPWSMVRDGLTHLDAPEHSVHRKLIAPAFAPRTIARMESRIVGIAAEVLDDAFHRREFDFSRDVAVRFAVNVVLGEVLGLSPSDFSRVIHWSDVIVAPRDPEFSQSAPTEAIKEIYQFGLSTFALRRQNPKDDVFSLLAHTNDSYGKPMSEEIFLRYFWSLLTGAFDTTASAISGGLQALIEFPEQYERLLGNPALLPIAVEEMIRWETPTIYFRRTALANTEIRGRQIERGQRVVMCYASANRDEQVFPKPNSFDIGRTPNDHLSFGYGPHFCLGASLARAEIRILFEQILQRRLHFELRGNIRRARSNFQNRIKQMPTGIIGQM